MNIKTMDNNQLFKAVVASQSAMKSELLGEISKINNKLDKVEKKLSGDINSLKSEIKKGFKEVNERIDKLGHELFVLDEDAPVGEDFAKLVKRVDKLETYQNLATV